MRNFSPRFSAKLPARHLKQTAAVQAIIFFTAVTFATVLPFKLFAQAPSISYTSPHIYTAGTAITPLSPANSGGAVAAPGYGSPATLYPIDFYMPYGVAADASGNVYVSNPGLNSVLEMSAPVGGTAPVNFPSFFLNPEGLAVSGGYVYLTQPGFGSGGIVVKVPVAGGVKDTIGTGFIDPLGVAVDVSGNVYVADAGNYINNNGAVYKISLGNGIYSAPVSIGSGFSHPKGVAVDAAGNVYVADYGNNALKKIPAGGGTPVALGGVFTGPIAVAVDASGNIYAGQTVSRKAVIEIPAGGGTPDTLGFSYPTGIAVDGAGNIYISSANDNTVQQIKPVGDYFISPALPAGLSFNNTTGVISGTPTAASPATNYTVTAYNSSGSGSTMVNIKVNALTISYSGPQTYTAGAAVTPLAPTVVSGVVAAPGYGSQVIFSAAFADPQGVAIDAAGNVYVADATSKTVYKVPAGGGTPQSIATGFNFPHNIAVDALGNVYVADGGAHAIYKIPLSGGVYGSQVQIGGSGFSNPIGIAVDAAGNIYVGDAGSNLVMKIPLGGGTYGTPFSIGSGFSGPLGIAVDAAGNVYVADTNNNEVKKIPLAGGTYGTPVPLGSGFTLPDGVAVDASGNVYVSDYGNDELKEIPAGSNTPVVIRGVNAGDQLEGIAVDGAGNVYDADSSNGFGSPVGIIELKPLGGYYINALPAGLSFNNTTGIISGTTTAASPATNYTVTAYNNSGSGSTMVNIKVNALTISYSGPQTYTAGAAVTPLAPTVVSGVVAAPGYGSQVIFSAAFADPQGVAIDAAGNVYVADATSKTVYKVPAGGGTPQSIATGFNFPHNIAVDALGNVYVADGGAHAIYKIPLSGGVYGSQVQIGGSGFSNPIGIAVDAAGNIYVGDAGSNLVMKIPLGGGTYGTPFSIGSGFSGPLGIAVDAAGNVYVADTNNNEVKKIPLAGGTYGTPVPLGSGFTLPDGVAVDASGNVYVSDYGNDELKEIPAGSNTPVVIRGVNAGDQLEGIAVDGAGNVYDADSSNGFGSPVGIIELKPLGGYYINAPASRFKL
jgi:sugar lactone lactonase YvrE